MDFNKEYARRVSKADFVKQHKHLGTEELLKAEWEKLQVKKEPVK